MESYGNYPNQAVRKDGMDDSGLEIASLLVKSGYLAENQLAYAQRVKTKLVTPRTLIAVLLELGFFSREQLRETLRSNIVSVKLGALLVELGHLKPAELQAALGIQRDGDNCKMLGEILVEQRFIEEYTLAEVLAFQLGYPFIDLQASDIDRSLLAKVPQHWLAQHNFVPVREENGQILVAIADPLNLEGRRTAEKLFGQGNTIFTICTMKAIREAFTLLKRGMIQGDGTATDEHTVTGIVNTIFEEALKEGASDIHIEPMRSVLRVRFRRDGMLVLYKDLAKELALPVSSRIKVMAEADIAERRRHQDGRICYESPKTGATLDMRVSFYITIHGEKIVLRLLSMKGELLDLKEIGMPGRMLERFIDDALDTPSGVLIVTGPTGSGKTSTLYSCVQHLNELSTSIVTAEEPVEYVIEGIAQCSINQKIGVTFEETLRHIVRQDPDIIVLGEIRDSFSAETAIQAALTGHKVLTTFHTEDSVGGLLRLMNMDIEAFLIASTVVCVLAQRLLRRVCPECAETYLPNPTELRRIGYSNIDLRGAEFKAGRGCSKCRYSGYRGRVGVFEMLVLNELVKDAILSKKTSYEIRKISTETTGMVTLLESGLCKAARGEVSLHDTVRLLPRIGKPRPIAEIRRLLGE
ncbi:Flp pilus assembly complex ATPase component TadA [Geomonas nitrogeniifigens]|uniref:Flp pilus assembly complex ATPase component TadA n=1 Tax=Geomonas diazotrophica TaxID=2843197 RepID=A0ABX8JJ81_9BACT|nr:GspE/PulE family protein [Geomonas nitrogeniifigens]QWV97798.1 Flp pilus assembly complex ATPase component TadA [Geomonas nitrogeniifigens]QXE86938.1 Flp pilus assembly complex ATPase component TadA [Geomonas nitrogeniifigens]